MAKNIWQGKCFGYHADLHLTENDRHSGEEADENLLYEQMKVLDPDWVQVESKGHPGYCAFRSKVRTASVAPNMKHDTVMAWRLATERLGVPMICHYSDFVDNKACELHPEWEAVLPYHRNSDMSYVCPRSGYFDELLIPELDELLTDYRADGVWLDGSVWGFAGCWCDRCKREFTARTGITEIPETDGAPHWQEWCRFSYDSFLERDAETMRILREKHPDAQFCSNWMGSHAYPNRKGLKSDWLSGDCGPNYSVSIIKREASVYSSTGCEWDLMSWPFSQSSWDFGIYIKPYEALCQEAAYILAYGGKWICCNHATFARSSRQVDWHLPRLNAVGKFIRQRKEVAYQASPVYDVSVFRSARMRWGNRLMDYPSCTDPDAASRSAILMVSDLQYSVNTITEESLRGDGAQSRVLIVPDREDLTDETVQLLKEYAKNGGHLIVAGCENGEKFGFDYFGAEHPQVETECPLAGQCDFLWHVKNKYPVHFLPDDSDGVFPMESDRWALLDRFLPGAVPGEKVYDSSFPFRSETPYAAWVTARHGSGTATLIPFDLFAFFLRKRMLPVMRRFLGRVIDSVYPDRIVRIHAPSFVSPVLRKKDGQWILHLLNGNTGAAGSDSDRTVVEEIPPVYGIEAVLRVPFAPKSVTMTPSGEALSFTCEQAADGYTVSFTVPRLDIHTAVVLEVRR